MIAKDEINKSSLSEIADQRFRPYPEYKDSGVEWLGEIPAHWEVRRLKTIASVELSNVDKKSVEDQVSVRLCNYINVYYNERITKSVEFMSATATPEQAKRFALRVSDVLITKDSESWTDIAVPSVVEDELEGVLCGYHLALIRPFATSLDGRFLGRAFAAIGPRDQFQVSANGITRFGLSGDAIRTGVFPVPPLSEQRAITTFLDRETAKTDAMVAKKGRLVELLKEKRTALITQAVTKGFDSNVPMKDSGVEWLGEIPAHWDVKRLKFLIREPIQYGANEAGENSEPDQPRFVRITDITERGELREDTFRSLPYQVAKPFLLAEGDLLFARSGATVGKSFLYKESWGSCCYAGYLIRVRLNGSRSLAEFISYFVSSNNYWDWIFSSLIQATIQNVSAEKFANLVLGLPSISEQQAICSYLDRETSKIDALVTKIHQAIDQLREFRTALISAAVTGKINVRGKGD